MTVHVIAFDIKYDTDGEKVDLPKELSFSYEGDIEIEELEDFVSDDISNKTGFCHQGFSYTIINPDNLC